MDLTKYSKIELLMKCQELGITKCKSKNKNKLIEFINKQLNKKINSNQDLTLNNITKCDIFTPDDVSELFFILPYYL
jgi:hypothetical protein